MANDKNIYKIETPAAGELLKKIQELEEGHAHLKQEMSKLMIPGEYKKSDRQRSNSISPAGRPRRITLGGVFEEGSLAAAPETFKIVTSSFGQSSPLRREIQSAHVSNGNESNHVSSPNGGGAALDGCGVAGPSAVKLTETQYMNIMQSMGQSVHMFDLNCQIIYWNQMAQNLYGYSVAEALGKTAPDIIIGPKYSALAALIIQRGTKGETWSGEFPVRNKRWERFTVITTVSPSRDESGTINGAICVSTDARAFQELRPQSNISVPWRISSAEFGLDHQQPLQTSIASKISNLASKVKSKIKTREKVIDHEGRSGDNHYSDIAPFDYKQQSQSRVFSFIREDFTGEPTPDSSEGNENRPGIHKVLSSKAEAWMGRKGILWPWKLGNESEENTCDRRRGRFGWPWLHYDQEQEPGPQMSCGASMKVENEIYESASASNSNEASGSCRFSSRGASSSNTNSITKVVGIDLDVEILWDDLIIREQIGQGSCGTVYHALWDGSDVAVKVFPTQEYPDDMILSFRKEVCLMKRLRHPNILLFMGVVTSPHHLCIVTEFLPRGSLFGLLQRKTTKLDWRRRVHMAMDIARGMNYLHHCHPPIVHLDLKSSNLVVDKNWTVKVGLSRIKHETYLTTKTGNGTPQWMAPEIVRNEQANEKSDVYSYGVVLWEIATGKIPWDNLNSMQVIGFMNQQLEIPEGVDPQWASLIASCCSSEADSRPTFEEILTKLKDLQKKFASS